jgi:hypothetical protein
MGAKMDITRFVLLVAIMIAILHFPSGAYAFIQGGAHNNSHMSGRDFTYFSTGKNCVGGKCNINNKLQICRQRASQSGIPIGPSDARRSFVMACMGGK